jgi:hypothetical protein
MIRALLIVLVLVTPTFAQRFPTTDSDEVNAILQSSNTVFYSRSTMPPAYQFDGGVHNVFYNISADPTEQRTGPGNHFEFPWKEAAGIHPNSTSKTTGIKALSLPVRNGKYLPIVYWTQQVGRYPAVRWIFPVGTEILECLFIADGNTWYPFELRRRTRLEDSWGAEVYSPIRDQNDLPGRMALLRRTETIEDAKHVRKAFRTKATHYALPPINRLDVHRVLSGTFYDVTGNRFGLTASNAFNLVPDKYFGAFAGSDTDSCMDCHQDTMKSVDLFDRARDWYGLVRGDDAIISFHPFEKSSISSNGTRRPIVMNRLMIQKGMLAKYNPRIHSKEFYSQRRR